MESLPNVGAVYGVGDQLQLGEVFFNIEHSGNTVALPQFIAKPRQDSNPLAGTASALATPEEQAPAPEPDFYCARCEVGYMDSEVKRIGLKGHKPHILCPHCSAHLVVYAEKEPVKLGFWARLVQAFKLLFSH
jgi:hypothetical protein